MKGLNNTSVVLLVDRKRRSVRITCKEYEGVDGLGGGYTNLATAELSRRGVELTIKRLQSLLKQIPIEEERKCYVVRRRGEKG